MFADISASLPRDAPFMQVTPVSLSLAAANVTTLPALQVRVIDVHGLPLLAFDTSVRAVQVRISRTTTQSLIDITGDMGVTSAGEVGVGGPGMGVYVEGARLQRTRPRPWRRWRGREGVQQNFSPQKRRHFRQKNFSQHKFSNQNCPTKISNIFFSINPTKNEGNLF